MLQRDEADEEVDEELVSQQEFLSLLRNNHE